MNILIITGVIAIAISIIAAVSIGFRVLQKKQKLHKGLVAGGTVLIVLATLAIVQSCLFFAVVGSTSNTRAWYLDAVDFSDVRRVTSGKSQKIAIIDSGISKVATTNVSGTEGTIDVISLVNDDGLDTNGHGTGIFSIVKGNEYGDVRGLVEDSSVISIKIMQENESISGDRIAQAIDRAIDEDCTVINLSLGSYKTNEKVKQAVENALEKNITVVASAGDYGDPDLMFPANLTGVISVGAHNRDKSVWKGTNAPNDCTILAPGQDIRVMVLNSTTEETSGTSQATAIISGYVACLRDYALQNGVELSNQKIIEILTQINQGELTYIEGLLSVTLPENSNVITEQAIYVTKESLTQDFKEGIDTINAEIENGDLERLEKGTLVKADDDQFYVQGGATYEKWGWWGLDKYCSTDYGNRWVKELKSVAFGSKKATSYISFIKSAGSAFSAFVKGLAYNVQAVNSMTSKGTITSLYWIPSWWCRPQG